MTKRILPLFFLWIYCFNIFAQNSTTQFTKGKTYALVIGVSNYSDPKIKDLKFAHRDAEIFSKFLTTKAGGAVPTDNIKLFTNENATIGSIYVAMKNLSNKVKKDDLVYLYFAGHGDVESDLYKSGFLLAHDTPYQNYLNNAIRIQDFNDLANTLSIIKKAQVIIITDACHSGKLSGNDNRGNNLIGKELNTVKNNEIRMASCEPEELAQEDEVWGGGRGVFSYYFINGMKGLADNIVRDGIVTLDELKKYLAIVNDEVFNRTEEFQTPVVDGRDSAMMAIVDPAVLKATISEITSTQGGSIEPRSISSFPLTPMEKYFQYVSTLMLENNFDFYALDQLSSSDDIVNIILDSDLFNINLLKTTNFWTTNKEINELKSLKSKIKSDAGYRNEFKQNFAAAIHDRIQTILNAYLTDDEQELERRKYYNSQEEGYDEYPPMINVAIKLIDSQNYLFHILEVKKWYFSGLSTRLKIPFNKNVDSLIQTAKTYQLKALAMEDKAAYIHNELGIIQKLERDITSAKVSFEKAIELVPTWAVPVSNLSGLYIQTKEYDKGIETAQKAIHLNPNYQFSYLNLGRNYDSQKNILYAEDNYRKAIDINDKHYLPFELMANIFNKKMDYASADNYYELADQKKRGLNNVNPFSDSDSDGVSDMLDQDVMAGFPMLLPCIIDTAQLTQADIMAKMIFGMEQWQSRNYKMAENYFKQILQFDKANPLVCRYLGELLYSQDKFMEAEYIFNLGLENYMDSLAFATHIAHMIDSSSYLFCNVTSRYKQLYFNETDLNYFLGDLYTKWAHYTEAEEIYLELIALDSLDEVAYFKLWQLYEKTNKFYESEELIRNYGQIYPEKGTNELYSFIQRMIQIFPNDKYYLYKLGLMHFNELPDDSQIVDFDIQTWPVDEFNTFEPFENGIRGINQIKQFSSAPKFAPYWSTCTETFLNIESKFNSDTMLMVEVTNKLGRLYDWVNDTANSKLYYEKSLAYGSNNSNIYSSLIAYEDSAFEFTKAFGYLKTLHSLNQLNYENFVLFTKYNIHSGNFSLADTLLHTIESSDYLVSAETSMLKCQYLLFIDKPELALPYFQTQLLQNPDDQDLLYSIARVYALMNDHHSAISSLTKAIDLGFKYKWVLDKDSAINSVRNLDEWPQIRARLN